MQLFLVKCVVVIAACWGVLPTAIAGEDGTLDDFSGDWVSTGEAFGQPARSSLSWSSTLGGKFHKVEYSIKRGAPDFTSPMFDGIGYYRPLENGGFKAFWADSSGDLHPIKAKLSDGTLTSLWGVAGEKLGRTEYKLVDETTLQVTDWIMQNYEWRQFNQNTFTRAASE